RMGGIGVAAGTPFILEVSSRSPVLLRSGVHRVGEEDLPRPRTDDSHTDVHFGLGLGLADVHMQDSELALIHFRGKLLYRARNDRVNIEEFAQLRRFFGIEAGAK